MSSAHDADRERTRSIATHSGNGHRHGAIPEQLSPNETLEPCRIRGRAFTAGRVVLEPSEQAFSITWRGRRGIADVLPVRRSRGKPLHCNPAARLAIDIESNHWQTMLSGKTKQRQVELRNRTPKSAANRPHPAKRPRSTRLWTSDRAPAEPVAGTSRSQAPFRVEGRTAPRSCGVASGGDPARHGFRRAGQHDVLPASRSRPCVLRGAGDQTRHLWLRPWLRSAI